jgi:hypothetical protein
LEKKALWDAVKDARRPEGIVVDQNGHVTSQQDLRFHRRKFNLALMRKNLDDIEKQRNELCRLVAITEARQDLLDLALARLQDLQSMEDLECGWDTRWLWDDSELQHGFENGSIFDGYPDGPLIARNKNHVPNPVTSTSSQWWCAEGQECIRHQGWVKLLQEDLELERSDQVDFFFGRSAVSS